MKGLFIFFLSFHSYAQNVDLFQKQLVQIMTDYPNKFRNLKDPQNPLYLKFKLSGISDEGFILGTDKVYISFRLSLPKSAGEARSLFNKWVAVIDQVNFNGVKMMGTPCDHLCGDFVEYSKEWAFDSKRKDLDPTYFPFKISLQILNVEGQYAASIFISNIN